MAIKIRFCLPYSQEVLISSGEDKELPEGHGMARAWTLAQVTHLALSLSLFPVSHAVLSSHLGMNLELP